MGRTQNLIKLKTDIAQVLMDSNHGVADTLINIPHPMCLAVASVIIKKAKIDVAKMNLLYVSDPENYGKV